MKHQAILFIVLFTAGVSLLSSAEYTSENVPRLKEFYTKFRKSDLNGDGVLTLGEMHDFLAGWIKDGARSDNNIKLRVIFKSSPDADMNGDGVLTKGELLQFVRLNDGQRA